MSASVGTSALICPREAIRWKMGASLPFTRTEIPFTFVDGTGTVVKTKVADFLDMTGYEYDSYVSRPLGSACL